MMEKNLAKKEREKIFNLFVKKRMLKFNEIEKNLEISSNSLSYHLNAMLKENILRKDSEYYLLTKEAEQMIPFFAHITGKEKGPLTVIVAAITNKNKICLLRRAKRPYQGYWGMIGGKLKLNESIEECALREVKEETGLDCGFEGIRGVLHERVKEKDLVKHAFVLFLCELSAKNIDLIQCDEGELDWFDLNDLPAKIIPSDIFMIKELLEKKFAYKEVVMTDKGDGELIDMQVK